MATRSSNTLSGWQLSVFRCQRRRAPYTRIPQLPTMAVCVQVLVNAEVKRPSPIVPRTTDNCLLRTVEWLASMHGVVALSFFSTDLHLTTECRQLATDKRLSGD